MLHELVFCAACDSLEEQFVRNVRIILVYRSHNRQADERLTAQASNQ
jgi:hypothetical protein